jgi:segregation and condensation protein B
VVYPDYMKDDVRAEIKDKKAVEIPSHKNAPRNPFKRAEMRYHILERNLCTKP